MGDEDVKRQRKEINTVAHPDAKSAQQTNNAQPIGERRVVWETGGGLFSLPETETALRRRRWGSENMEAVTTRGHLQRVSALS